MATIRSSQKLTKGDLYTRRQLAELFSITDATLNTGVFQPKGHSSIWLFVTGKKPANRTQYVDALVGETLHWQGQTSGRTDQLIIDHDHEERGLELLVFYREEARARFRYEGPFEYAEHSGGKPNK